MKSFFRQVFAMIRENKLFSAVYIVGTAVAIAFTMVMVIAYYVKIAPVYPETNRMRTMYLGTAVYVDTVHFGSSGSGFSPDALNEWGYHLKNAEVVSGSVGNMGMIRTEGDIHDYLVKQIYTDVNFFKVYPFRFKEGRPFTQEEFDGAAHVAVISDEQARKTYGSDKGIVGRTLFLNADTMRIVGVVESASPYTYRSYAQVYTPYSLWMYWPQMGRLYAGNLSITMVLPDANGEQALREEIEDVVRRHNLQNGEWRLKLNGQPVSHV
ncbi:MAG: ABC transporter permease [Prevotellaceae bacterium]|nr:ABC transporter permease [Prevotellaceae bacterium]